MTLFSPSYVFLALKKQVQITTELETPKEAKATQLNNKKKAYYSKTWRETSAVAPPSNYQLPGWFHSPLRTSCELNPHDLASCEG